MWVTLLLIAHGACEWVEISQHHYRNPVGVRHNLTTKHAAEEYVNQTISPHTWRDHRTTNIVSSRSKVSNNSRNNHGDEVDRNIIVREVITEKPGPRKKEYLGIVERIPNVGKVRRVQLASPSVNSPSITKSTSSNYNFLYANHEASLETFDDEAEETHRRVFYNNNQRKQQVYATEANVFNNDVTKISFKNYTILETDNKPNYFVTGKEKITKADNLNNYSQYSDDKPKITPAVRKTNIKIISETSNTADQSNKINSGIPTFVSTENTLTTNKHTKIDEISHNNGNKSGPVIKIYDNGDSNNNIEETKANREDVTTEKTLTPKTKVNTMEVLMKVMKTVADTISKNSYRSVNSKTRYLHKLKNTMLDNIEYRIDTIWPDDDTDYQSGVKRRSRSARGHVEFPSSESALMTISFLTFAVFLIKLVLQVIQTYKNKTMMVAPLVVATAGRAATQRLRANIKLNN